MRDFTIEIYKKLLETLIQRQYVFQTFQESLLNPKERAVIIRQDVDKRPAQSLVFAEIQNSMDIKSTFYFRANPCSFNPQIIRRIVELGHEIGYHYEDMAAEKGNFNKAYDSFCRNLELFRKYYPVKTICMHGSPISKFDNRDLWKQYNYKELGIIGEPYFDIDFSKVFYLTDTGRRWNGNKFIIRDKPTGSDSTFNKLSFKKTIDIINAVESGAFPETAMITFHPQRWNSSLAPWIWEKITQNLKNQVKYFLNRAKQQ